MGRSKSDPPREEKRNELFVREDEALQPVLMRETGKYLANFKLEPYKFGSSELTLEDGTKYIVWWEHELKQSPRYYQYFKEYFEPKNKNPAQSKSMRFKLKIEWWDHPMREGELFEWGTIRTDPENYYVASIMDNNTLIFRDIEAMTRHIDQKSVVNWYIEQNIKLPEEKLSKRQIVVSQGLLYEWNRTHNLDKVWEQGRKELFGEEEIKNAIGYLTRQGLISKTTRPYKLIDINEANIGDLVGAIDGPGQNPKDNVYRIISKETSRFGSFLKVQNEQGNMETVEHFTDIGIGWYYLGKPSTQITPSSGEKITTIFATPHIAGGGYNFTRAQGTVGMADFIDIRKIPSIAREHGMSEIHLAGDWDRYGHRGFGEAVSVSTFEELLKKMDFLGDWEKMLKEVNKISGER